MSVSVTSNFSLADSWCDEYNNANNKSKREKVIVKKPTVRQLLFSSLVSLSLSRSCVGLRSLSLARSLYLAHRTQKAATVVAAHSTAQHSGSKSSSSSSRKHRRTHRHSNRCSRHFIHSLNLICTHSVSCALELPACLLLAPPALNGTHEQANDRCTIGPPK